MKCAICEKVGEFKTYTLKEMMFGFKDEFNYFECAECGCFQIENIPVNMEKYYPKDYYAYNLQTRLNLKPHYFKSLQFNQLSGHHKSILGLIASFRYKSAQYNWFKNLNINKKTAKVLDIGCGEGQLLKGLYMAGFKNLTGVDPYIEKDISYNSHLNIYKKEIFELKENFDLIMLHHSLEHMPDQQEVIKAISEILSKNGKLLIRIPVMSQPLFDKYGVDLVSLDPPRHFFIHTIKSITLLLAKYGLSIYKTAYDAEITEFIASEQYKKGISMNSSNSYFIDRKLNSISKKEIVNYENSIKQMNAEGKSSTAIFYIERTL